MASKKKSKKKSGDWRVEVVAYDDLTLAPGGTPNGNLTRADIDKLLGTLALFADSAGKKLNDMDICPNQLTLEGHVSLDVGGGVLLFGVSTGVSVSMTWEFQQSWTGPRDRRRTEPAPPEG